MDYGLGDQLGCFAVGEVTHILQHHAAITSGEECFEPLRFAGRVTEIGKPLNHESRCLQIFDFTEPALQSIVTRIPSLALSPAGR